MMAVADLLMAEPEWIRLALLALLAGILSLDDTALAQTWISQPLPAGILAGLVAGEPVVGLAVGLPLQLVMMGNLPVGQTFTGDPTTAVVSVVGAASLAGLPLDQAMRGQVSQAQGLLGWLLLAAGLLSLAGHFVVQAERSAFRIWMLQARWSLRDGDLGRLERLHLRCLATTLLRGSLVGTVFILLVLRLWLPLFEQIGEGVRSALALLPLLLPAIGIGTMIERYGLRRSWPWVLAGAALAFLMVWGFSDHG